MHARDLLELGVVLAANAPAVIRSGKPVDCGAVEQYWVASKSRLDRWSRSLRQASEMAQKKRPSGNQPDQPLVALLEEIITGELLARVVAAVAAAYDEHHKTDLMGPVAQSVLMGQMEARHRALNLLVQTSLVDAATAVRLNRLRRRTERWTDLLIGYLCALGPLTHLAHDPNRARDFAGDLRRRGRLRERQLWTIVEGSFRAAFAFGLQPLVPNGQLNRKIAAAVVGFFPPELFDGAGVPRPFWLLRLTETACDAETAVEELLRHYDATAVTSAQQRRLDQLAERLRRFNRR